MNQICQLDRYTTVISDLTGRTIYVNDSLDQFLVSPFFAQSDVAEIATWWLTRIEALRAEHKPPPGLRAAVAALVGCQTRDALAAALQAVLVTEYQARLATSSVATYQRFLVELLLRLWGVGAVAWPAKLQVPFSNPALILDNPGFPEQPLAYLTRIRAYLNREGSDDAANFRFILDHLLARSGVAVIGDLTPTTFYLTEERSRHGKMRSTGIQGVLNVLREAHPEQAIAWAPEDFGFFKTKMGHLARDDKFEWLVSKDQAMTEWARLAIEHLERTPTNFRKRKIGRAHV